MAEEFVDLYEVLGLPVDADRNTLRKKINELYLDAQRNLDHRTFATRVKYQELFEVTLPQARYILLDDGRRDEYTRLVHAFRATKNGTPAPPPNAPASAPVNAAPGGFALESDPDASIPGSSGPKIEPLPTVIVNPEQLAKEREELWKKWKTGLEEALTTDGDDRPKARSATTAAPSSFTTQPASASAPPAPKAAPVAAAPVAPAPSPPAPQTTAKPKVNISFDFNENDSSPAASSPEGAPAANMDLDSDQRLSTAEIEQRRTEHRRQIMKDLLVNVGLIWGSIGAAAVVVPGLIALIAFMGKYYPRNAAPLIKYSPNLLWSLGFLFIGAIAFFVSRQLSKSMRRKKAGELSFLSYEDLLKQVGKS